MLDALRIRSGILAAIAALLLAGCGWFGDDAEETVREDDPATTAALRDQITVDPDLAGQNRADSAAFVPSGDGSVPTVDRGAGAISGARAEALELVGGPGKMEKAPDPRAVEGEQPAGATLTAAARAAAAPGDQGDCAARAQYTMDWAARLPAAFPVYPRGAVQEA